MRREVSNAGMLAQTLVGRKGSVKGSDWSYKPSCRTLLDPRFSRLLLRAPLLCFGKPSAGHTETRGTALGSGGKAEEKKSRLELGFCISVIGKSY